MVKSCIYYNGFVLYKFGYHCYSFGPHILSCAVLVKPFNSLATAKRPRRVKHLIRSNHHIFLIYLYLSCYRNSMCAIYKRYGPYGSLTLSVGGPPPCWASSFSRRSCCSTFSCCRATLAGFCMPRPAFCCMRRSAASSCRRRR